MLSTSLIVRRMAVLLSLGMMVWLGGCDNSEDSNDGPTPHYSDLVGTWVNVAHATQTSFNWYSLSLTTNPGQCGFAENGHWWASGSWMGLSFHGGGTATMQGSQLSCVVDSAQESLLIGSTGQASIDLAFQDWFAARYPDPFDETHQEVDIFAITPGTDYGTIAGFGANSEGGPINGVKVDLKIGDSLVASTVPSNWGFFVFNNLAPAYYYVEAKKDTITYTRQAPVTAGAMTQVEIDFQ